MKKRISFVSSFSIYFPLISTIFLLFLFYLPFSFGISNSIKPCLVLASVFFWLTHRPDVFGIFSIIIVAIFADTLSGNPLGANLLMLSFIYLLINKFEAFFYNKPFMVYWYFFMMFAGAAFLLKWFVLSVYYTQFLPITSVLFMYLTTIICYPFVSIFNAFVQTYVRFDDE
ncbi:MAG: hypothetical protein R3Y43_00845 [Alphaproteobacteria bacterium]